MPILDEEDYSAVMDHAARKNIPANKKVSSNDKLVPGEDEKLIYFSAFISRDSLSSIADEIGLDEDAWNENFKYEEEFMIEATVNLETGEITRARLTGY